MFGLFCLTAVCLGFFPSKIDAAGADNEFDPSSLVLDDVVSALFPKNCAAGENWKNEKNSGVKAHCNIPRGHLTEELTTFANDAEAMGCVVDKSIAKYMGDNFGDPSYASNPVLSRLGEDCGFCGIKVSCCGTKNAEKVQKELAAKHPDVYLHAFYFQSIKGLPCSDKSNQACSVKPLSSSEFDLLAKQQPFTKKIDRSDDCNFAQFGFVEWEAAKENPSFPVAQPLYDRFLCRSTQTNRPKLTCVKNPATKQCMCCCYSYTPVRTGSSYSCIQQNDKDSEQICFKV